MTLSVILSFNSYFMLTRMFFLFFNWLTFISESNYCIYTPVDITYLTDFYFVPFECDTVVKN